MFNLLQENNTSEFRQNIINCISSFFCNNDSCSFPEDAHWPQLFTMKCSNLWVLLCPTKGIKSRLCDRGPAWVIQLYTHTRTHTHTFQMCLTKVTFCHHMSLDKVTSIKIFKHDISALADAIKSKQS